MQDLADCSECTRQDPVTKEWITEKKWKFHSEGDPDDPHDMYGFYYHHEPVSAECALPGHLEEWPDCVTTCQCTGCMSLHFPERIPQRNVANNHCFTCTCQDCVCDLRRQHHQFNDHVGTPHWDSLCLGMCPVCHKQVEAWAKQ